MSKTAQHTNLVAVAMNSESGQAPEWVQLTPAGPVIEGRDGRRFFLSEPQAVIEAFKTNQQDLPIDIEHSTQIHAPAGNPAPAVGWISKLEVRTGQIWGRVEWTPAGEAGVAGREYRYLSPAFAFDPETKEIQRLVSAGITNQPNFKMAALNKIGDKENQIMDPAVLEALGLKPDATAVDAVVAINALKDEKSVALNAAQTPDPKKFVPVETHEMALNRLAEHDKEKKEREEAAINSAVDAAVEAGKIPPASKDFYVATCKANGVEAFNKMADQMPVIADMTDLDKKDPETVGAASLTPTEIEVARAMGFSSEEFANAKREQENKQ